MKLICENGLGGMNQAISILVNVAMIIERSQNLQAEPYERTRCDWPLRFPHFGRCQGVFSVSRSSQVVMVGGMPPRPGFFQRSLRFPS